MDAIIRKATAEDKTSRFQSVAELRTDLLNALALNKVSPEGLNTPPFKAAQFVQAKSKWIWIGIILTLASLGGMEAWHLIRLPQKITPLKLTERKADPHDTEITLPKTGPKKIFNCQGWIQNDIDRKY